MARKTAIDKLNEAIAGILNEYGENIRDNVGEIAEAIGKKGVQALRRESRSKLKEHTGKYAKGWKMQVEKGRMGTKVTIYNEHPALPHLLENGHVTKNQTGKTYARTPAHPHIAPVEKELVETFKREVLDKL